MIKRGQLYYADLSPVVGSEQGGVRPVLILQNDIGNKFSPTVIAAATTSRLTKAKLPTHIALEKDKYCLPKDSIVLLEQIRTLDKSRLLDYIGELPPETMNLVNTATTRRKQKKTENSRLTAVLFYYGESDGVSPVVRNRQKNFLSPFGKQSFRLAVKAKKRRALFVMGDFHLLISHFACKPAAERLDGRLLGGEHTRGAFRPAGFGKYIFFFGGSAHFVGKCR